jgi:hypothetical protein
MHQGDIRLWLGGGTSAHPTFEITGIIGYGPKTKPRKAKPKFQVRLGFMNLG